MIHIVYGPADIYIQYSHEISRYGEQHSSLILERKPERMPLQHFSPMPLIRAPEGTEHGQVPGNLMGKSLVVSSSDLILSCACAELR